MPDESKIDHDKLWTEDREAISNVIETLHRVSSTTGPFAANKISLDREELEKVMITYCSRIRQQTENGMRESFRGRLADAVENKAQPKGLQDFGSDSEVGDIVQAQGKIAFQRKSLGNVWARLETDGDTPDVQLLVNQNLVGRRDLERWNETVVSDPFKGQTHVRVYGELTTSKMRGELTIQVKAWHLSYPEATPCAHYEHPHPLPPGSMLRCRCPGFCKHCGHTEIEHREASHG